MDKQGKAQEFYVCSRCGLELPRESFSWRNSGQRRYTQCKSCVAEKVREWRVANPEKYKRQVTRNVAYKRARRRSDPAYRAHSNELSKANKRAKSRVGEQRRAMCKRCGSAFEYVFIQRKRDLCDVCRAHHNEWRDFKLTGPQAAELRARKRCDICGRLKDPGGRFNNWHIDHDHVSGKVRGLLCAYCNTMLGLMDHNAARLRAAADYLEETNGENEAAPRVPNRMAPTGLHRGSRA